MQTDMCIKKYSRNKNTFNMYKLYILPSKYAETVGTYVHGKNFSVGNVELVTKMIEISTILYHNVTVYLLKRSSIAHFERTSP